MSFPHYPKYKKWGVEWLGKLPEHWEVTQLKRLVEPTRPLTYGIVQAGPHVSDGVPYVRPADMSDEEGVVSPSGILRTTHEIANAYARSTIRSGDLVCSIGPSFGKVMVTPAWLDGANLTQGTARIAVRAPNCARFVFWALRSASSFAQWESSVGGATFRALNLGPLAETAIAVPGENEQALIAQLLDRETSKIDALIAEQQRLIELLEEKRQAVISQAVTKGLNPDAPMKGSGVEWLGNVPAHWREMRLRWLFKLTKRQNQSQKRVLSVYRDFGVILKDSRSDNFNKTPEDVSSYQLVRSGDLVINKMKAWQGSLGISAHEGITSPDYMVFSPRHDESSEFLHHLLRSQRMVASYRRISNGIRLAQWRLESDKFLDLRVFLPPPEEQEQILAFISHQVTQCEGLTSQAETAIDLLHERRTALISAAVTGKIDVRHLADAEAA